MEDFCDEEWGSLSRMLFNDEKDMKIGGIDESLFYFSDTFLTNFHNFSQDSSNSSGGDSIFSSIPSEDYHSFTDFNHIHEANESFDFCTIGNENISSTPMFPNNVFKEILSLKEGIRIGQLEKTESQSATIADIGKELQLKRKSDMPQGDNNNKSSETTKKPRVSRNVERSKKNSTTKKNRKLTLNQSDDEDTEMKIKGQSQSSSNYSSEDHSNASNEINGGEISEPKMKTRASRGAATDPQSLYARRRRERINERLRILQNLVPNGTKVDISTMLEEAVHYVKFLQLQIKLLSSDELWMYAPIAYNGMDIGLLRNISPTL